MQQLRGDLPGRRFHPESRKLIIIKQENNRIVLSEKPLGFYGDLKENYEKYNHDYPERM